LSSTWPSTGANSPPVVPDMSSDLLLATVEWIVGQSYLQGARAG
jgi:hypothetical protein